MRLEVFEGKKWLDKDDGDWMRCDIEE